MTPTIPSVTEQEQKLAISYFDEMNQSQFMEVKHLFVAERVSHNEKCDSILAKIIYSKAQFKAAEGSFQQC